MQNTTSIQDLFLNQARKEKQQLTVFLVNGFQIKGQVTAFDSFTVALFADGKQQIVYKHAISTIIPAKSIKLSE